MLIKTLEAGNVNSIGEKRRQTLRLGEQQRSQNVNAKDFCATVSHQLWAQSCTVLTIKRNAALVSNVENRMHPLLPNTSQYKLMVYLPSFGHNLKNTLWDP